MAARLRHLHHHGPSHDELVGKLAIQRPGVRQVDVRHAGQVLGHHAAGGLVEGREDGAAGDAAGGEGAVRGAGRGVALELDSGTGSDGSGAGAGGHGEGREGRQDQVRALGAARDEGRGEREDLLGRQGRVKGLGNGDALAGGADEGLVAGLDREDGTGGGQDRAVRNKGSGAEVGRHADVLEDGGGADHAGGGGEAKVVGARLHGLDTGLGDGALQEGDVLLLSLADLQEVVDLPLLEAESLEVGGGELGETLLVEGRFEPLEREGTVEEGQWWGSQEGE